MRRVNLQIQPIFFGLPTAEHAIHKIGHSRAQYFTVLDNKHAFLDCLSRKGHVTSQLFVVKATFKIQKVTFGLNCSSALYQLQLSNLLDEQLNTGLCLLYQDDLLIFSRNWDRHLSLLQEILEKYHRANCA
jgi:hypothetical protein